MSYTTDFLITKCYQEENEKNLIQSGRIKFPGLKNRFAEYIYVKNDINPKRVVDYIFDKNKWNINRPNIIFSVSGVTKKNAIPNRMRKAFKTGLTNAAGSTESIIITNGSNEIVGEALEENTSSNKINVIGVCSWGLVAYRDQLMNQIFRKQKIVLYGVQEKKNSSDRVLDSNHSHFILVDNNNSKENDEDSQILFRSRLEEELRKKFSYFDDDDFTGSRLSLASCKSDDHKHIKKLKENTKRNQIPIIKILIHGSHNMLLMCREALKQKVPILILSGSKGFSDLIANAINLENCTAVKIKELLYDSQVLDEMKQKANYNDIFNEACENLSYISFMKKFNLINVFQMDSLDVSGSDIEEAILKAIFESQKSKNFDNLKLALEWNRIDLVKKNDMLSNENYLTQEELFKLLEIALVDNKPDFVKLFLDHGTSLNNFLTYGRFYFLYNSKKIFSESKRTPFYELLKANFINCNANEIFITMKKVRHFLKHFVAEELKTEFIENDVDFCLTDDEFDVIAIKEYLDEFYDKEKQIPLLINNQDKSRDFNKIIKASRLNLYIWALLLNRVEIAKIIWQIGNNQIATALLGSILLKNMHEMVNKSLLQSSNLRESSIEFLRLSVGVLDLLDNEVEDEVNFKNLLKKIPIFGMDCLEIAVIGNCQKFVATNCVQNLLTTVWNGNIISKNSIETLFKIGLSCLSCGVLAPFLVYESKPIFLESSHNNQKGDKKRIYNKKNGTLLKDEEDKPVIDKTKYLRPSSTTSNSTNSLENDIKNKKYWTRFVGFFQEPRICFIYDTTCYITFLIIFSYFLLCDFGYKNEPSKSYTEHEMEMAFEYNESITAPDLILSGNFSETFNSTNRTLSIERNDIRMPSILEYVLIGWIVSLVLGELRQFFTLDEERTTKKSLKKYFRDGWNYIDISGCLFFIIGMSLRVASVYTSEFIFVISRIVLCIDLSIWFMRLLHVSLVFKSMGPKLVMIQKMLQDLIFFITFMLIFVFTFAVITHSTLYPRSKLDFYLFHNLINFAYWPIFGNIKIFEELDKIHSCVDDKKCPEKSGIVFSIFVTMLYMILTNVLLINLLIAMFSNTFQRVELNADQIWKFQRYSLVYEYVNKPSLPPPFNLISFLPFVVKFLTKNIKKKFGKKSSLNFKDEDEESDFYQNLEKNLAEIFLDRENNKKTESTDEKLKWAVEKIEVLTMQLNSYMDPLKRSKSIIRKEPSKTTLI